MRRTLICLIALLAPPVAAECPPAPDHSAELARLKEQARQATTEMRGREIGSAMWALWADAPDAQAQEILDRGMRRRSGYDFAGALEDFERLIDYCPYYAEGYNQRAFIRFIREDYAAALVDLQRALELSPDHVAARAGLALTLMNLGEVEEARRALKRALDQNPWLPERHLLAPGGALAPEENDI